MLITQLIYVYKFVPRHQIIFHIILLLHAFNIALALGLLIIQQEDVLNFVLEEIIKLLQTIQQDNVCLYALMELICKILQVLVYLNVFKVFLTQYLNFVLDYVQHIITDYCLNVLV
jgi:hypothetical protein